MSPFAPRAERVSPFACRDMTPGSIVTCVQGMGWGFQPRAKLWGRATPPHFEPQRGAEFDPEGMVPSRRTACPVSAGHAAGWGDVLLWKLRFVGVRCAHPNLRLSPRDNDNMARRPEGAGDFSPGRSPGFRGHPRILSPKGAKDSSPGQG